jgi:hypothetical protein
VHEQWSKATQEGPAEVSPLRSDGSCDGHTERINLSEEVAKDIEI